MLFRSRKARASGPKTLPGQAPGEEVPPSTPREPETLSEQDSEEEVLPTPPPPRVFDKPPFPCRLVNNKKQMDLFQFNEIKDIFSKLSFNVPFLTAIKNMPSCARYLKELCTLKRNSLKTKKAFKADHIDSLFLVEGVVKYRDPR